MLEEEMEMEGVGEEGEAAMVELTEAVLVELAWCGGGCWDQLVVPSIALDK